MFAPFLALHGTHRGSRFFNTTTNTMTTTTNNTLSVYIVNTSIVNYSDVTIRTIVPSPTGTEPYRKIIVAIFFFRRILALSNSPFISLRDLTATVASYFDIIIGSAEREVEYIVEAIHHTFSMLLTFRKSVILIPLVKLP